MNNHQKSAVKTLVAALAATGLLVLANPALAERGDHDDRGHKGRPESHVKRDKPARFQQHNISDRGREHRREERRADRREERRAERRQERREERRAERRAERRREERREERREDRRWERHAKHHGGYGHGYDKHHRPHYKPGYRPHKHRWRPDRYHYGYRWHRLPTSYVSLSIGGLGYYFSDGIFYRPYGPGYVVAQAPVGALVYNLPGTAINVSFGGLNYYVAYDTYYRWDHHHRGYRVVANPGFY